MRELAFGQCMNGHAIEVTVRQIVD